MHRTPVRQRRTLLVAWLPLAALALVLAFVPNAEQLPTSTPPAASVEAADPIGAAAMRVKLDPESGTLVHDTTPLAQNKAPELEAMLNRSDVGLVQEFLPNGTVRVDLQGRFQNASVAHIGDDGAVHTLCSDQLHEVQGHLNACTHASSSAPALEVK